MSGYITKELSICVFFSLLKKKNKALDLPCVLLDKSDGVHTVAIYEHTMLMMKFMQCALYAYPFPSK